jgi:hypothetical protein
MSNSLRKLSAAIDEFAHRPPEEAITPDQLRDLIAELEGELEFLYEPDPALARAQHEADMKAWIAELRAAKS